MKLSVCPQALYNLSFDEALRVMVRLGFAGFELPVDAKSPFVDLDDLERGGAAALKRRLKEARLELSAISNHQEGQLLLGPHHRDTDSVLAGTPEEKSAFARRRLLQTARVAVDLDTPLVVGFLGCEDYSRWFPWPDPTGFESMGERFRNEVLSLLDEFRKLGVVLAVEPHPKQFIYNTETALLSLKLLEEHPNFGFNLDPANLLLAGVDPVIFVAELAPRIRHVHAKDGELVPHQLGRSGLLAHGAWDRPDRGFRFRIPGWGDIPWKRLISELQIRSYDGWLTIENEDPVFEPIDGLEKAVAALAPLIPKGPPKPRWW